MRGVVVLSTFALTVCAGAQGSCHSNVVGAALGVATYEGFALAGYGFESFYEVGFHFSGDFYRNEGRLTHLVTFDITATRSIIERDEHPWAIEPIYLFELNYNLPIYLTTGRSRLAVRPLFGARFATSAGGGSQGQFGILGGVRATPFKNKGIILDVYAGLRFRYGNLDFEWLNEGWGWKSTFIFRNANTFVVSAPLCIYVTTAVDFDISRFREVSMVPDYIEYGTRKPTFSVAVGPALYF